MLGERLGRGGMAEVFSGYVLGSHGFQKPVAIKRLLPERAKDRVFVDRLVREAKLLVGMQHGNIVSVLDLARDGEDVFLVMEYVDGPTLGRLLKARGSRLLTLGCATYFVQAAAAGLEYAHARPGGAIIHADISPSNLLLTTSGEVRVADFGIARREGGSTGRIEGKWAYMPPEQVRGEPLTTSSDVFALGVVLYELITGHHPLGRKVTYDERGGGRIRIVPPRTVNPAIPLGLDAICMTALAEDPRDRYARMQHLIDAIVDERFANQWREGASDLALAIGEVAGDTVPVLSPPRTQRTVTIATHSLISQPRPVTSATVIIPPPGGFIESLEPPHALGSVHDAAPTTSVSRSVRARRWLLGGLGAIVLSGVIAAVTLRLAPAHDLAASSSPQEPRPLVATAVTAREPAAPAPATGESVAPARITPAKAAPTRATPAPVAPEPAPPTSAAAAVAVSPPPASVARRPSPAREVTLRRERIAKKVDAILRVNTFEGVWAWAHVNGRRQYAPGAKFKLAAGRYTVRLTNPDLNLAHTCTVTIDSGEVVTLKVELEVGECDVSR